MREIADLVSGRRSQVAAIWLGAISMAVITLFTLYPAMARAEEDSKGGIQFAPDDDVAPPAPIPTSIGNEELASPEVAPAKEAAAETKNAEQPQTLDQGETHTQPPADQPSSSNTSPDTKSEDAKSDDTKSDDTKSDDMKPAPPDTPQPESQPKETKPAAADKVEESPKVFKRGESHNDQLFGSYRVRLMYARPTFNEHLKYYNDLYGKPKNYPELAIDWFAWDWYATLGLSTRFGYYTADGNAAQLPGGLQTASSANLSKDVNGPTTLTLIPVQLLFTMEITPFPKKWLVLDGWFGWERLYFQETRNQKQSSTASTSSGSTTSGSSGGSSTARTSAIGPDLTHLADFTISPDKTLTNTGWRNASVVGGAANILLNALDEESTASLRAIGIGGVYLSPYLEWIKTINQPASSTLSFGRTVIGLAFTFESLH
jgi:hypothetical protein